MGQPVSGLPTRERGAVMQLIVDLADQSIHEGELDAGDGLPAAAMAALDRALEQDAIPVKPRRATSRYQAAPSGLASMLRDSIPWEWLIPTATRCRRMKELESPLRERVMERYGLGGDAPRTLGSRSTRCRDNCLVHRATDRAHVNNAAPGGAVLATGDQQWINAWRTGIACGHRAGRASCVQPCGGHGRGTRSCAESSRGRCRSSAGRVRGRG